MGKHRTEEPDEKRQSQGNVVAQSSPHMQRSLLLFFFFFKLPFEISNSSLWTKSCLSENIDPPTTDQTPLQAVPRAAFPLAHAYLCSARITHHFCTRAEHSNVLNVDFVPFSPHFSSFLPEGGMGTAICSDQVGALSPAIHLGDHRKQEGETRAAIVLIPAILAHHLN